MQTECSVVTGVQTECSVVTGVQTQPELIVDHKEDVVESDEEQDDNYMISKAPVSAKLPAFLQNRGRKQVSLMTWLS